MCASPRSAHTPLSSLCLTCIIACKLSDKSGRSAQARQLLYLRVSCRAPQADLWEGYAGDAGDSVDVEIYQAWLQPAAAADLEAQAARRSALHSHAQDGGTDAGHEHAHGPAHAHGHAHSHGPVDHGDHVHEACPNPMFESAPLHVLAMHRADI